MGILNPQWANNVSYRALHQWVRRNKPMANSCENCGAKKPLEAANISGEYKRDISDFEWLCRPCHMQKDGRINNLKQYV